MAKVMSTPNDELPDDAPLTDEDAARRMQELLASLPSPPSLEELARAQGAKPVTRLEDMPEWPEDDLDAWDGFDEFLEELRHGRGDLRRWAREQKSDDR
jgi:hypothetical protein